MPRRGASAAAGPPHILDAAIVRLAARAAARGDHSCPSSTRTTSPVPASGPRRAATTGGAAPERRTVLIRQGILFGGFLIIAILLVFVVRSCQQSAKENALKDYNREVASIVRESDTQVGRPFFELMRNPGSESATEPRDDDQRLPRPGRAAVRAGPAARRAGRDGARPALLPHHHGAAARRARLDRHPRAHRAERRRGGGAVARSSEITGAMQLFLTSDVIYETRTFQFIRDGARRSRGGRPDDPADGVHAGHRVAAGRPRSPRRSASRCRRAAAGHGRRAGAGPPRHGARLRARWAT